METPKIITADFVFAALVNGDEVLYTYQKQGGGSFITVKLSDTTMNVIKGYVKNPTGFFVHLQKPQEEVTEPTAPAEPPTQEVV